MPSLGQNGRYSHAKPTPVRTAVERALEEGLKLAINLTASATKPKVSPSYQPGYSNRKPSRKPVRQTIGPKLRLQILQRDNFRCRYCGATSLSTELEVDHIKPVSRGGGNDLNNLQTLCRSCNRGKSNRIL